MWIKILCAQLSFILCGGPSALAYAAAVVNSLLKEAAPKTVRQGEVLTFRAKDGFHFNLKAPQNCGEVLASEVSKTQLQCRFPNPGMRVLSLKICDDRETFCKSEEFPITVTERLITK